MSEAVKFSDLSKKARLIVCLLCIFLSFSIGMFFPLPEPKNKMPQLNSEQQEAVDFIIKSEDSARLLLMCGSAHPLTDREKKLLTLLYLENPDVWTGKYKIKPFFTEKNKPIRGNGIPFP